MIQMLLSTLASLFLLQASAEALECRLFDESKAVKLGAKTVVKLPEKATKIISCESWNDFPDLVILRLKMSAQGTSQIVIPSFIYIVDKEGRIRFEAMTNTEDADGLDQKSFPVELRKTTDGKPAVYLKETEKLVPIKVD